MGCDTLVSTVLASGLAVAQCFPDVVGRERCRDGERAVSEPRLRSPGDRRRRSRTLGRGDGGLPRPEGDRGREGVCPRRGHSLVRRLDVGAAEPAVPGRRDRRGHRRAPHLPQARARRELRRTPGRGAAGERPAHGGVLREPAPRCSSCPARGSPTSRATCPEPAPAADRSARSRSTRAGSRKAPARQAATAAVRDVVPRDGDHGRPGPAGVPARDDVGQGVLPRRLAGRVPRVRPGHLPARHAAGQRHRADRPADASRPTTSVCRCSVELAGDAVDSPTDGAVTRRGRWPTRTGRSPSALGAASCWPPAVSRTTSRVGASCSRAPRPGGSTGRWRRRRRPATGSRSASRPAACLDTSLASPAAWCPVSLVPYRSGRVGTYPHIVDRGKPGLIAVLSNGKRFVNEADGYYQFTSGDDRRRPRRRSRCRPG